MDAVVFNLAHITYIERPDEYGGVSQDSSKLLLPQSLHPTAPDRDGDRPFGFTRSRCAKRL